MFLWKPKFYIYSFANLVFSGLVFPCTLVIWKGSSSLWSKTIYELLELLYLWIIHSIKCLYSSFRLLFFPTVLCFLKRKLSTYETRIFTPITFCRINMTERRWGRLKNTQVNIVYFTNWDAKDKKKNSAFLETLILKWNSFIDMSVLKETKFIHCVTYLCTYDNFQIIKIIEQLGLLKMYKNTQILVSLI